MQFHRYRAPPPSRPVRQFTQLEMPLSRAFQRLVEGNLHYAYHQRVGHDTDNCAMLRHAIQDLIDQGLVDLGRPTVTTDPLPTHDTRVVPPPLRGLISLYEDSDFSGYIHGQQVPRPFRLIPDEIPRQTTVSPVYLQHVPPMTPFILFPEEYGPVHRDVKIITQNGRVAQPPPIDRPFVGTDAREEVQREDDEILRYLLASSSTHRDALIRALSQIIVDTTTTLEGLIHFLMADRATCIVFSYDDLPPDRSSGASILLDNGFALNVCPLVTVIALGFSPSDFRPSTVGQIFYTLSVLRIQTSFNLLLGRPWIHEASAIPYSFHQKVKFIHEECIIMIQFDRDVVTSSEPMLQISHSDDDLHLIGFTFDEV
ncbi:hypothetical protein AAG906_036936 [Vitis piasezkii]